MTSAAANGSHILAGGAFSQMTFDRWAKAFAPKDSGHIVGAFSDFLLHLKTAVRGARPAKVKLD